MRSRCTPAETAASAHCCSSALTRRTTSSGGGKLRHCSGRPRMCMRTAPHPRSASVLSMFRSQRNPLTSFTISAPASAAARATAALYVSTEITAAGHFFLSSAITGMTRFNSSSALTVVPKCSPPPASTRAPGRVDSPPMSMNVRALVQQPQPVVQGFIRIEKLSPIGKGIRRDIQYAHDQRAFAQFQRTRSQIPLKARPHAELIHLLRTAARLRTA